MLLEVNQLPLGLLQPRDVMAIKINVISVFDGSDCEGKNPVFGGNFNLAGASLAEHVGDQLVEQWRSALTDVTGLVQQHLAGLIGIKDLAVPGHAQHRVGVLGRKLSENPE